MRVVYYKYPNEEDESVIVTEIPVQRDTAIAIQLDKDDLAEYYTLHQIEGNGRRTLAGLADPLYKLEDIYFLNLGNAEFEAILPFRNQEAAKGMADVIQQKMLELEAMWNE